MADKTDMQAVEKFKKLAQLALSEDEDGEATEEARNAAVKAIELLADEEGDLIVVPRTELAELQRKIEGQQQGIALARKEEQQKTMLWAAAAYFFGKGGIGL